MARRTSISIAHFVLTITPATLLLVAGDVIAMPGDPLGTTVEDFFQQGTQSQESFVDFDPPVPAASDCIFCHSSYDPNAEPYANWSASMMGQSARDPLFHALFGIAEADAPGVGVLCIRCHAPNAHIRGNTVPAAWDATDREGVGCNFCHRLVDPVAKPENPAEDEAILDDLESQGLLPPQGSNARYIIDPVDSRRGPLTFPGDIPSNPHFGVEIITSPFHRSAELCWNCHDVSNPVMERQPDETYTLDLKNLDAPHPTGEQTDMFPLHRTYSEWKNSYYNTLDGVQHNGRFGGNHPTGIMNVCQDCHLPDQIGFGCGLGGFPERQDVPQHSFIGGNYWVLKAVRDQFPDSESGLSEASVATQIARVVDMLENASDLFLAQIGEDLRVRVMNQTGHKLPTGFPDGRRVWVNVKFYNDLDEIIREHGHYDFATAVLTTDDTVVYEAVFGMSDEVAELAGLDPGPTMHFPLANEILKDNRIPPQGFSNVLAVQEQHEPVGASYIDGQHWDDTLFAVPAGAVRAVVTVYYESSTKEFIDFLDANSTDGSGATAKALWETYGKGTPVVMDMTEIEVDGPLLGDLNGDGIVDATDLAILLGDWGPCEGCPADINGDGVVDAADLAALLGNWGATG